MAAMHIWPFFPRSTRLDAAEGRVVYRLSIETLPLWLVVSYFAGTVSLFFYGPFTWPISNADILLIFLFFVALALIVGFILGAMCDDRKPAPFRWWRAIFVAGGFLACVMIFPSAYVYTGRMPWDLLQALADQRAAYEAMLQRLVETDGSRAPIAIARALSYPFVFAVIPLGILHWSRLTWWLRVLLFATMLCGLVFSILRGTDREAADTLLVAGGALLVLLGRYSLRGDLGLFHILTRWPVLVGLFATMILATAALSIFVDRKASRLDEATYQVCVGEEHICADIRTDGWAGTVSRRQFGLAMLTAYFAQGYYGTALALNMEFQSTLGLGHSPLVARAYEAISGDPKLYMQSYTYRLREFGWSDETQYSTIFTWIANDIGFPMVVIFMGVLSFVFCLSWKDAVYAEDDRASILFCLLLQMLIYLPANNQIMQTLDAYFALMVWVSWWGIVRLRSRLSWRSF